MSLKKILLIIVVADLVLATIAYFVVFYNTPGTYEVATSPIPTTSTILSSSSIALASGTASSSIPTSTATIGSASSSTGATGTSSGNPSQSVYATAYAFPYPLNWSEGDASISIMGAALQGNQLTLELAVAIGNSMQCVPLNVKMLIDEQGDLASPITPQFTFPETNSCEGAPGATYTDQQAIFNVDLTAFPLFFTTGGASNIFFQVATTTDGGVSVTTQNTSGQ
jgi:hypothetical protein